MPGWTDLSPELRQKCIKNMSLMSSCRLGMCSKIDKKMVDSMEIKYPHVRFGERKRRYLIVIYTGINTFLRVEVVKENGLTVVYRSENSYNSTRKVLSTSCKDHYKVAVEIFKNLLINRPNVSINTLEWSLKQPKNDEKFFKIIGESEVKFRVNRVICGEMEYNRKLPDGPSVVLLDSMVFLKHFSMKNTTPTVVQTCFHPKTGKPVSHKLWFGTTGGTFSRIFTSIVTYNDSSSFGLPVNLSFPKIPHDQVELFRDLYTEKILDTKQGNIRVEVFKFNDESNVWLHTSPCGVSAKFLRTNQTPVNFKYYPCLMGMYCDIHSSPFDAWYIRSLPLRLAHEPFWSTRSMRVLDQNDKFLSNPELDENFENDKKPLFDMSFGDFDTSEADRMFSRTWAQMYSPRRATKRMRDKMFGDLGQSAPPREEEKFNVTSDEEEEEDVVEEDVVEVEDVGNVGDDEKKGDIEVVKEKEEDVKEVEDVDDVEEKDVVKKVEVKEENIEDVEVKEENVKKKKGDVGDVQKKEEDVKEKERDVVKEEEDVGDVKEKENAVKGEEVEVKEVVEDFKLEEEDVVEKGDVEVDEKVKNYDKMEQYFQILLAFLVAFVAVLAFFCF